MPNEQKHKIIAKLFRGLGFRSNLEALTRDDIATFDCSSIEQFEALVVTAVRAMREMVGIETETLAVECALALDGGSEINLMNRREEFLFTETFSMRTLMRYERQGVDYLVTTIERARSKQLS